MRAVVLTNPQSNQNALVSKLARQIEIAAIVHSRNIPKKRPTWSRRYRTIPNKIAARVWGRELRDAWFKMLQRYEVNYEPFQDAPVHVVENVNDDSSFEIIKDSRPEIVIVSGTNIVGRRLIRFSQDHGGIVNLHTGISPYVKGGPNCTNWCLAKGWFHLIGNTVMWLDAGVDTGEIIATERTPLSGSESLDELHWKVMEHAHEMYVTAITGLIKGTPLPRVKQSEIADGVEFRSSEWTGKEMRQAVRNFKGSFRRYFDSGSENPDLRDIKLFPLARV